MPSLVGYNWSPTRDPTIPGTSVYSVPAGLNAGLGAGNLAVLVCILHRVPPSDPYYDRVAAVINTVGKSSSPLTAGADGGGFGSRQAYAFSWVVDPADWPTQVQFIESISPWNPFTSWQLGVENHIRWAAFSVDTPIDPNGIGAYAMPERYGTGSSFLLAHTQSPQPGFDSPSSNYGGTGSGVFVDMTIGTSVTAELGAVSAANGFTVLAAPDNEFRLSTKSFSGPGLTTTTPIRHAIAGTARVAPTLRFTFSDTPRHQWDFAGGSGPFPDSGNYPQNLIEVGTLSDGQVLCSSFEEQMRSADTAGSYMRPAATNFLTATGTASNTAQFTLSMYVRRPVATAADGTTDFFVFSPFVSQPFKLFWQRSAGTDTIGLRAYYASGTAFFDDVTVALPSLDSGGCIHHVVLRGLRHGARWAGSGGVDSYSYDLVVDGTPVGSTPLRLNYNGSTVVTANTFFGAYAGPAPFEVGRIRVEQRYLSDAEVSAEFLDVGCCELIVTPSRAKTGVGMIVS